MNLMEKHLTCCLHSAQDGSPSSGKRLPPFCMRLSFVTLLPFGHEVTEKIPSTYVSSISLPGMRALEKGIEP